jgi:hypothetical protein
MRLLRFRRIFVTLAKITTATVGVVALTVLSGLPALAHDERDVTLPDGTGDVPEYRTEQQAADVLLVCQDTPATFQRRIAEFPDDLRARNEALFEECQTSGHRSIQDAVDAVTQPSTNIYLLPGEYTEDESRADLSPECAELDGDQPGAYQVISYEQQVDCPHTQNLIAILGVEDLQIEGTGQEPGDVIIDADFSKLNGIRADRANGIYLKNFTAQETTFNAVYILETDGFVIDDVVGRWNDEYGFLTFGVDHGLYENCEAYGNGDSGVYPGSASNINEDRKYDVDRYSVEIRNCYSHHNLLGYSGTAGDSVWAHDNDFSDNSAGVAMDSLFPDHPGLPQNHALFENNLIYDNNQDYYGYVTDGTCALPRPDRGYENGVVCPAIGIPPGTGLLTAGGNYNVYRDNHVYGNDYTGFLLLHPPAFIRDEMGITDQWDTSNRNSYIGNTFGQTPTGDVSENGLDLWWDGQGAYNCWQDDIGETVPLNPPDCGAEPGDFSGLQTSRVFAEPTTLASLYVCGEYSLESGSLPAGCEWLGATGIERVDVQLTLVASALVGLIGLLVWWRFLRRSPLVTVALGIGIAGLIINVIAVPLWSTILPAVAITMIGLWLLIAGSALVMTGKPGFGWLTIAFGLLALLHAVDKAIVMLPWIPLSPAWFRLLVGIVWVFWGLALLAASRKRADEPDGGDDADEADEPDVSGTGQDAGARPSWIDGTDSGAQRAI